MYLKRINRSTLAYRMVMSQTFSLFPFVKSFDYNNDDNV